MRGLEILSEGSPSVKRDLIDLGLKSELEERLKRLSVQVATDIGKDFNVKFCIMGGGLIPDLENLLYIVGCQVRLKELNAEEKAYAFEIPQSAPQNDTFNVRQDGQRWRFKKYNFGAIATDIAQTLLDKSGKLYFVGVIITRGINPRTGVDTQPLYAANAEPNTESENVGFRLELLPIKYDFKVDYAYKGEEPTKSKDFNEDLRNKEKVIMSQVERDLTPLLRNWSSPEDFAKAFKERVGQRRLTFRMVPYQTVNGHDSEYHVSEWGGKGSTERGYFVKGTTVYTHVITEVSMFVADGLKVSMIPVAQIGLVKLTEKQILQQTN